MEININKIIDKIKNYINECSEKDYFNNIKKIVNNQIQKLKDLIKNLESNLKLFEKYFKINLTFCKDLIKLYENNNKNYKILHNLNNINYNNYEFFKNKNFNDIINIYELNDFLKNILPYKFIKKEEFIKNENNLSKIRENYFKEKIMLSSYKLYKQINDEYINKDLKYDSSKIIYKIDYLLKKNIFYSGEFSKINSSPEGIGIKKYNKGDIYIGNFENGLFNGYGKLIEKNGTIHQGFYKEGKYNGFGKIKFNNGAYYLGYFIKGKKNGFGIYYFENKDFYIGEWKDDNRDGFGLYFQKEKNIYYGEFSNNFKNGLGIFYFNCPKIYDSLKKYLDNFGNNNNNNNYNIGDILKGDFNKYSSGDIYEGEYKNSQKKGIGVYKLKNNMIYKGEFYNGNYEGYGFLVDNNKNIFQGYFYNDEIYYGIKTKNEDTIDEAGFFENFELNGLKFKVEKIPLNFKDYFLSFQNQMKQKFYKNDKIKINEEKNEIINDFVLFPDCYILKNGLNKKIFQILDDEKNNKEFYKKKEDLKKKLMI